MSFEDRIETLKTRHQSLEAEVKVETQRPHPDTVTLNKLKREKLRVKDEIARLSHA